MKERKEINAIKNDKQKKKKYGADQDKSEDKDGHGANWF